MKPRPLILSLLPSLVLLAASAQAALVVSFPGSDRYTDVGGWGQDPRPTIEAIERHIQELGTRYISPRDTLRIEVIDIDLAGEVRPLGSSMTPVRIVRGPVDWPRITVRYTLESPGASATTREETLTFREGLSNRSEVLYHEKRMLDDWFRARFGK